MNTLKLKSMNRFLKTIIAGYGAKKNGLWLLRDNYSIYNPILDIRQILEL